MKPDLKSKPGKYYMAKKAGKSRIESMKVAGYSTKSNANIEKTGKFQAIEAYFKDEVVAKMSIGAVADELVKNIKQDKDKGAKNTAIKTYLDKVEPDASATQRDDEVVVLLRPVKVLEGDIVVESRKKDL